MIKTGVVISILNKKAGIMTSSGEFVYIKINKVLPNVGEIYTGELCKKSLYLYKHVITAASLMFILLSSSFAYSYYTPVTTIVVSINPSISFEANRWNKIISSKALNSDGSLILNNIKLRNKSIDAGLELLVKEAQTENFINDKYVEDKKVISVDIKSNKNSSIDISNFKNIVDNNKLTIKINASAGNNKSIDITINNKKVSISNLNPSNKEKENTNKNSNIKNGPAKKTSIDGNTNINENKPPKAKEKLENNSTKTTTENTKINKDDKLENKNPNSNKSSNTTSSTTKKSEPQKKNELIKKSDDPIKDNKDKHDDKDKKH